MLHERATRGSGLAEKAYTFVKLSLLEGIYRPGSWVPVDEIATKIGTSRQPVMDAMKRLANEGFIEIVPQVGSRVRQHTPAEIKDFYALFRAGESLIAELAACRATPSEITRLRLISGQIKELLHLPAQGGERGELYRTLNRELHGLLREIIRSPTLAEIVEGMGDISDFLIAGVQEPVFSPGLVDAHAEHERVLEAIALKDPRLAHAAMEAHIRGTERRLLTRLGDTD